MGLEKAAGNMTPSVSSLTGYALAHDHLMVDLSLRVHHQNARHFWRYGNGWRADRVFDCGRRRKGCVRDLDLGDRCGEEQDRRKGHGRRSCRLGSESEPTS